MEEMDKLQSNNSETVKKSKNIDSLLYLGSSIIGLWFVYLFYNNLVGISFLLFIVSFYVLFFIRFRQRILIKSLFSWFLFISTIALSCTYFIFSNTLFFVLNFPVILFLILSQNFIALKAIKAPWDHLLFIKKLFINFIERILLNLFLFFQQTFSSIITFSGNKNINTIRKVLIGLLISIPMIFIVIALLAFADDVFRHYMNNLLQSIQLADFIKQVILFFIIASVVYGYLWSFLNINNFNDHDQSSRPSFKIKRMDPVISMTFLVLFNMVYIGFFLVQYAYMFGAIHYVLPEGFSPAEYARKGFSEMLIIALINFAIYFIYIKFKAISSKTYAFFINMFITILVLSTLAILFSAHLRLTLYEAAFGYTYLRILTHSFMFFLFALILVALIKIWIHQVPLKKTYIVISLIAFISINYMNIDRLIAVNNIQRYYEIGEIDEHYLHQLSLDSYPNLVDFYMDHHTSPNIYQKFNQKYKILTKADHWASFNISRRNAIEALEKFFQIEQLRLNPFSDEIHKMEF